MNPFYKKAFQWSLPLLAGAIFPLAFSPFGLHWIGYISPFILLMALAGKSAQEGFKKAALWGLGAYGVGVSWVYVSIHVHGNTHPLLAILITFGFALFFGLVMGVFGYVLNRGFPDSSARKYLIAFPTLWVSTELLLNYLLTGFPWLYIGYTQLTTPLSGYATIFGVWGVSFFTTFVVGLLFYVFSGVSKYRYFNLIMVLMTFAAGYGLNQIPWVKPTGVNARIALVQGSIPQQVRWDEAYLHHTLSLYYDMTHSLIEHNGPFDIIVWPESAIPLSLPYAEKYLSQVRELLPPKTTLITGVPEETPNHQHYNSVRAMGNGSGVYYKQHLVPFGEYVPLESWLKGLIGFLDIPMSDFIPGPQPGGVLIAPPLTLAPAICYEAAYPNTLRKIINNNDVDAIVTISNDAWFGNSMGPHQHQDIAHMRGIENGITVIRSTNSGITSVMYPDLRKNTIPQFTEISLIAEVPKMTGKTPWTRMGPWPFFSLIWGLLVIAYIYRRKNNRSKILS